MVLAIPGQGCDIHRAPVVSLEVSMFPWRKRKSSDASSGAPHQNLWMLLFECVWESLRMFSLEGQQMSRWHCSNCLHNLCHCKSHEVAWQIFNLGFGTHRLGLTGGIKTSTAGEYFIILIWFSLWAFPSHPFCKEGIIRAHTHTHRWASHLCVHEDRTDAKERSHSHPWDDLCVWVWRRWTDADATCLWEYRAQKNRLFKDCLY